jgi:hypothetical protein
MKMRLIAKSCESCQPTLPTGDRRVLDTKLAEVQREHGKEASELRRRIAWFTENQELVSERDAHVKRRGCTRGMQLHA